MKKYAIKMGKRTAEIEKCLVKVGLGWIILALTEIALRELDLFSILEYSRACFAVGILAGSVAMWVMSTNIDFFK